MKHKRAEENSPVASAVDVGSAWVDLPILYHQDDGFIGIFSATYNPVRALLPSRKMHPITLLNGRAMVAIVAFNYFETSIGPYGEVGIVIPCAHKNNVPPLLPMLLEAWYPGWGGFVVHLPVTSLIACDSGRVIYGYNKFMSDMDFQKHPYHQRVHLSESGSHVLTLTVQQRGIRIRDNRPLVTYSVRNGELLRTTIPSCAVYQMGLVPGLGVLELGDHEIADWLRSLDISSRSVFTRNYLTHSGILPAGEVIGKADMCYTKYAMRRDDL